jgi:hypothetical protein
MLCCPSRARSVRIPLVAKNPVMSVLARAVEELVVLGVDDLPLQLDQRVVAESVPVVVDFAAQREVW